MKYIVYKTTNVVNKKIYIGVHITKDPDIFDGYIGCGMSAKHKHNNQNRKGFPAAVEKYGYENFIRETLFVFEGDEEGCKQAYKKEAELVTEEFVKDPNTYNITTGGHFTVYNNLKRPINQYTMEGKYIKTWDSITEAHLITGISSITAALQGKYHHCGGYQWRYYTNNTDDIKPYKIQKRTVYQFDLAGNLLKVWKTASEAATYYGITVQAITNCCLRKSHQSIGYFWSYKHQFEPLKYNHLAAVAKYDDEGKFLKSYTSLKEASEENKIATPRNIIAAIQGTQKRCGGFRWRYFYGNTSNIKPL